MFFEELRKKIILWATWREIKQLKDKKGFLKAGLPKFNRLFGRDSLISAWQLLNRKPGICQATLEILSQYQGKVFNGEKEEEPGKILHETDLEKSYHSEGYFPFPYYGSIDSTPLFLMVFTFYFKKTNDRKFLDYHWENILRAINWMEECGDKDKDLFLEYQRKNEKGLFHQGWKDSFENHLKIEPPVAIVEVQGYQYLALKETAKLAEMKKDWDLVKRLSDRANKLKEEFNEKFWIPEKNYFALALDGKKEQRKAITSNPGHLLFTGIIDREKIDYLVKRLFEKDLWTPYGIRTHSTFEPDFDPRSYHLGSVWPHDNWIISQGLKKLGYKKECQKIKNAILLANEKIGYLPEFYGVIDGEITLEMEKTPCYPQAWAAGALFNFLSE
ncbi:MAG: hypothetical protein CO145_01700 [Candidatus Nealsonbacteria bacterium CG_4_9_14_3_um_filter_37_13]|uniref:Mannosylglycerate hydrolase MGH1-like glycoside hydrolase domain-containing protein n=1 Tax=Candidatus Nealsonbacteria bacterium CG_4_9_14_3_um_filter_37_13 TaxID=1974695 RepID=A0A2M7Z4Y1_9BACT|nr:MAG: hypothetical protein CO145_01700 [Candidatus Nealsonbacteria bacterium CG_4_9_14_3_um_filter_37_13]